jgi:hypothetical protein
MVKPVYLLAAVMVMLVFLVILGLSVFAFNNDPGQSGGPFDNGASPSLVQPK